MGFQPIKFPSTMATNASISNGVDLGSNYGFIWLEVPTMATAFATAATPLFIQASSDNVTFRRICNIESNTTTVGVNDFQISSSVTQRFVNIPALGFRYLKVEASATVTGAVVSPIFNFICAGY